MENGGQKQMRHVNMTIVHVDSLNANAILSFVNHVMHLEIGKLLSHITVIHD